MYRSIKNFVLILSAFMLLLPRIAWGATVSQVGGWLANLATGGGYDAAGTLLGFAGEQAVDKSVRGVAVILNALSMAALQLGGFFAEAALALSLDVVNSSAVQTGFKIALTLANLGFVIAIVVIALATIFRNQTYGIKRALVRLVVMAILVNFSLILTGVALNFSDRLTIYFLDYSSPDLGDGWKFSSALMNGLQGQAFQVKPGEIQSNPGVADTVVREIIALFATIIFTSLVALAIWVLAITLFLRYIWITLLLIVMPVAWIAWIFPSTSGWWDRWWKMFIKWTFYAPAMMFFVYLALTLANTDFVRTSMTAQGQTAEFLGMWSAGTVQTAVKSMVIVFLLFGGFIAANSMGIGLAGSASAGAQNLGKKMWGATKRGAGRGARRAGGTMFGETLKKYGEKWQGVGANRGWFGRTMAAPVRGLGAQLTKGKETLTAGTLQQYIDKHKNKSETELINGIAATRGVDQVAYLELLKDSKRFTEAVAKTAPNLANEDEFKRWGKGELYKTAKNKSGLSFHQYAQKRAAATTPADHDAINADLAKTIKETGAENFVNFFKPYDSKNPPLGMTPKQYEQAQAEIVKGLAYYGSTEKIRKVFTDESFDKDRAELFKDAGTRAGITEAQIQANNPKFYNWATVGKGKGMVDITDFT